MMTVRTYPIAVSVHPTREALGLAAGTLAARHLRVALEQHPHATVMLAAAPSQAATLAALATEPDVEWSRVSAFHMGECLGLDPEAPQGFGNWLERSFVSRVPSLTFNRIRLAGDPQVDAEASASRLPEGPFDVVLLGLGVNGHLAFNDPPARFDDPQDSRVVELDDLSRRQQVDAGPSPQWRTCRAEPSQHHPATPAGRAHRGVGSPGRRNARRSEPPSPLRSGRTTPAPPWGMPRLMGYSWAHSLEQGGGMLMNVLPHFLGQAQFRHSRAAEMLTISPWPAVREHFT